MDYKTFPPSALLANFVKCFWSLEAPASPESEKQIITPDGCMELIVHYGDPYLQFLENGKQLVQPSAFVFGQITSPLVIAPSGSTGIVAARFHPDGFSSFTVVTASAMSNRAVPLKELFGIQGLELEELVVAASTIEARISVIENFLIARLN